MAEDCQTVDDTGSTCDHGAGSNMEVSIKKEVYSCDSSQAELSQLQTATSVISVIIEPDDNTETKSLKGTENDSNKDGEHSEAHLMQLAEILYKCTLCTSLPSILTSKESFLAHVKQEHVNKETSSRSCSQCDLKFDTDEDLRAHDESAHTFSLELAVDSDDSDSKDSVDSGKDKSLTGDERRPASRPSALATPSPTAIKQEPSNIPRQEFPCNKYQVVKPSAPVVKVNELYKPENLTRIKQLTDQIVQSQTPGHQNNMVQSWSSMSSFTPEFGRYTKLVREGGNIVYFCQVCNWKCQVKAAFQAHCNGPHHANKVRLADQNNPHRRRAGSATSASPGRTSGMPSPSPSPPQHTSDSECQKSTLDCYGGIIKSEPKDSIVVPSIDVSSSRSQCSSVPEMPFLQGLLASSKPDDKKMEEGSNFIFQKRCDKEKTPEYKHPGLTVESYFEKKQREGSCGSPAINKKASGTDNNSTLKNKRKRPTPVSLRNQSGSRHGWSDSDTDDCATDSTFSDSDQPHPKKSKPQPQPVQRDDFHSRLMKRACTGVSHLDKSVNEAQGSPFGEQHRLSQYIQNSLRNRLFANAYGAGLAPMYGWFGQPNPPFPPPMGISEENGLKENTLNDNPYEKSLRYGSKLFSGCLTQFDYSGKHQQLSETISTRSNNQSDNSEKGDSSPRRDGDLGGYKIKPEPLDNDELQCSMCDFTCRDFYTYRHHFLAEHDTEGGDNMLAEGQFNPMNEGWKVSKIRDCLPGELTIQIPGNSYQFRSYQCF